MIRSKCMIWLLSQAEFQRSNFYNTLVIQIICRNQEQWSLSGICRRKGSNCHPNPQGSVGYGIKSSGGKRITEVKIEGEPFRSSGQAKRWGWN